MGIGIVNPPALKPFQLLVPVQQIVGIIELVAALKTVSYTHLDVYKRQALELCLEGLELYKGDFLPKSEYESWVIPISTYYHLSLIHI